MDANPMKPSSGERVHANILEQCWCENELAEAHYSETLDSILGPHSRLSGKAIQRFQALLAHATEEAKRRGEQNGVAWAIGVIDELHIGGSGAETTDRLFKGVKNNLRDRFKAVTGVDPAPSYPVNTVLKQTQPTKEDGE